jgi:hypothetical protein
MSEALTPGVFDTRVRHPRFSVRTVYWLRRIHGWIGLWGAVLGLIFGLAGVWLNHRAILMIPMAQRQTTSRIAVPQPAPARVEDMANWLREVLPNADAPNSIRAEPARRAPWVEDGAGVQQPEHWTIQFGGPKTRIRADYWLGNRKVSITQVDNGFAATLTNLHKGTGMSVFWILLVDTLAGSIIFLSVSGVALWMLTNRRRIPGMIVVGTSVALTLALILSCL